MKEQRKCIPRYLILLSHQKFGNHSLEWQASLECNGLWRFFRMWITNGDGGGCSVRAPKTKRKRNHKSIIKSSYLQRECIGLWRSFSPVLLMTRQVHDSLQVFCDWWEEGSYFQAADLPWMLVIKWTLLETSKGQILSLLLNSQKLYLWALLYSYSVFWEGL